MSCASEKGEGEGDTCGGRRTEDAVLVGDLSPPGPDLISPILSKRRTLTTVASFF